MGETFPNLLNLCCKIGVTIFYNSLQRYRDSESECDGNVKSFE